MEIKKLDKWKNKIYGAENHLVEFENGVRLVVGVYPTTQEFVMHVIVHGGGYLEDRLGVPHGTAHFVEHLLCNPNRNLLTFDALDHYRSGNSKRPRINTNSYTTVQNMTFYGVTHIAGAERLIDDLTWQMDYPRERLVEFIEAERKIILAEEARELKEDRDKGLHFRNFLLKKSYPEYRRRLIGKSKDIQDIKLEHICKYLDNVFIPENVVITIQTNEFPNKAMLKKLEHLANIFSSNSKDPKYDFKYKRDVIGNAFEVSHFKDTDYQHVYLEAFSITPEIEGRIYTPESMREIVLRDLLSGVLSYRLFKGLREVKNLVYNADTYSSYPVKEWIESGVVIECPVDNFAEVLEELYVIINTDIEKFLTQKEGQMWLTNYISSLIFKPNIVYYRDYARNIGLDVIREITPYKGDHELYKRTVRGLKPSDILDYFESHIKDVKLRFWAYSPYEDDTIVNAIKASKIGKELAAE
jgi:predicted Zn-dependent peptidase